MVEREQKKTKSEPRCGGSTEMEANGAKNKVVAHVAFYESCDATQDLSSHKPQGAPRGKS
eukprot:jgi/Psemu1/310025/fgenesh1_kg.580_\